MADDTTELFELDAADRTASTTCLRPDAFAAGLTGKMVCAGVNETYRVLDSIDEALNMRLSKIVELANLSSILGNVMATGIVAASAGTFDRAGPHKYQDLRPVNDDDESHAIEIKVALENNKPKGHLPKVGYYLAVRYVLGDADGNYKRGTRGDVVWIWEVRLGWLDEEHFSVSNTAGDSGKTAVVRAHGMKALKLVYFDRRFCPRARIDAYLRDYG